MELDHEQRRALDAALRDAFRTHEALRRMVRFGAGRPLDDVVAPGPVRHVVAALIEVAEAEGWLDDLLTGAVLENPGNPRLRALLASGAFADAAAGAIGRAGARDGLAVTIPGFAVDGLPPERLESVRSEAIGFQEPAAFAARLQAEAARVCRVDAVGPRRREVGTGFLVGPDLVLTAGHVVAPLLERAPGGPVGGATFRFDHRFDARGGFHPGPELTLAPGPQETWLVAWSPASPADRVVAPVSDAGPGELDFALMRLAGSPGDDATPGGVRRGWAQLDDPVRSPAVGLPLLVIQHPQGLPVKVAFDTPGVVALNRHRTRMTYEANTEPGSSGSPVYTLYFELVGLHHAAAQSGGRANQGVPLAAIADALRASGAL